jgi:hypothetical protein
MRSTPIAVAQSFSARIQVKTYPFNLMVALAFLFDEPLSPSAV